MIVGRWAISRITIERDCGSGVSIVSRLEMALHCILPSQFSCRYWLSNPVSSKISTRSVIKFTSQTQVSLWQSVFSGRKHLETPEISSLKW